MATDQSWLDALLQGPAGPTGPAGPAGGGETTDVTHTADFTCNDTNIIVPVDTSGGPIAVTLPPCVRGTRRIFKDAGLAIETNALTITSGTTAKVQNPVTGAKFATSVACGPQASAAPMRNGSSIEVLADGTDWITLRPS